MSRTEDPPSCIHGFSGNGAGCPDCSLAAQCQTIDDAIEEINSLRDELANVHAALTDDEDESPLGAAEQRMRDLATWKECSETDSRRAATAEAETARLRLLLEALRPFANLGEYRDLLDRMSLALHPHERAAFIASFLAARVALAKVAR